MPWTTYQVILRLHTPLHIGWGRVSYLQRACPYVTGRALRGALISRVGRNNPDLLSANPQDPYRSVSKTFAQYLTFTYFYPALQDKAGKWEACFPWEDEITFRRRFLSSYVAAALEYPQQTAAEGLLYETEFLSPYTLDDGKPVYLMGYIFVDEARLKREKYDWCAALQRLQLGGERGYGWGEARLVENGLKQLSSNDKLFDIIRFDPAKQRPSVYLEENQPVLAHTPTHARTLAGPIEPMVGREWRADNPPNLGRNHIGQHLSFNGMFFTPGSRASKQCAFYIGEGGYWQPV